MKFRVLAIAMKWSWRALFLAVVVLNLRLYSPTVLAPHWDVVPKTIAQQLKANRKSIDDGGATSMQKIFPEGHYFCHVLHGLAWVELAMRDPDFRKTAISEAKRCLQSLETAEGKTPYPANLPPDHGMFYTAWKTDLRAGLVRLQFGENAQQLEKLRQECDLIAQSLTNSPTPFLASYEQSAWPCDSFPAVHALVAYGSITSDDRYGEVISHWLRKVKSRLDPTTGLVGHTASLPDGATTSLARATSQVVMLRFLADIDPQFARAQYELFRKHFCTTFVGAPCVLEYPKGTWGRGDVDSGPLLFGRSLSGTVLTIGLAQMYGDQDFANAICQAGEVVGMPWTNNNGKTYWAGMLPVGNIIVAYSYAARPWFSRQQHVPLRSHFVSPYWRLPIHMASALLLIPELWLLLRRRKRQRDRAELGSAR